MPQSRARRYLRLCTQPPALFSHQPPKRTSGLRRVSTGQMLRTAHFRLASQYEETLWATHEADIGDFFETHEAVKVDTEGNIETDKPARC
jgi:hypothetical protein